MTAFLSLLQFSAFLCSLCASASSSERWTLSMATFFRTPGDTTVESPAEAQRILALGAEISGSRACLIEPVDGAHRIVGWMNLTRAGDGMLPLQVAETCRRLGQRLGCALWDEELNQPFQRTINPVRYPPVQVVSASLSARGPVRLFVASLTGELSAAAVRASAATAPAAVVAETHYDAALDTNQLATMLANSQADALVIAGGFDRSGPAARQAILAYARVLAQAVARLSRPTRPAILYAGCAHVAEQVTATFRAIDNALAVEVIENVLPEPGVVRRAPLARVLSFLYWRLTQRIIGFKEFARWVTTPGEAVTVETSFVQMMQAWAFHQDLPWVHGVYCGPIWWVHVWTGMARKGAQVLYAEPHTRPAALDRWPPLSLVSGAWPVEQWDRPPRVWWDERALAPIVATAGKVAPRAMMEVLEQDVLIWEE